MLSFTAPVSIRFPPQKITDVSFVVQWDAVINQSVDRYIVSVYRTDDDRNAIQSVTVNETLCTVTELTPNTMYTVTVTSVDEPDCAGAPSTYNKVNTTVSISLVTTITIHTRPPSISISPTATAESDNYLTNSDTKLIPTLDVTVISITTLIPTVIATNPVITTGTYVRKLMN